MLMKIETSIWHISTMKAEIIVTQIPGLYIIYIPPSTAMVVEAEKLDSPAVLTTANDTRSSWQA